MKKIVLLAVSVPTLIAGGIIYYVAISYDFTPSTRENEFGISAKLAYSDSYLPIMCPISSCQSTHFKLVVSSQKDIFLRGYNICKEIFCVKKHINTTI